MRPLQFLLTFCICAALGGSPFAQSAPAELTPLETREAAKGWEAVGRLDIDDAGFCTATLVREDLILTAAHCVYERDGTPIARERFRFQAGLRDGRALADRTISRIMAHPAYAESDADWPQDKMAHDLALLTLNQPIRFAGIDPIPLSPDAYPGDHVAIVSYGGSRAEFPSLQADCALTDKAKGVLVMDCAAERGTSGAPVLRLSQGRPRVVGIVAAIADLGAEPISLAVPMHANIDGLLDLLGGGDAATEPSRNDTGAKFIRP